MAVENPVRALLLVFVVLPALLVAACDDNSVEPVDGTSATEFLGRGQYSGEYWPTDGWRSCAPEQVGMSSRLLLDAYRYAASSNLNTEGLVIIKDGYIVGEAYFDDFDSDDRHYSYSVAKSFTGTVVGIAVDEGLIDSVEVPVFRYFPQWQQPGTDPRKQQITVGHLLTMMSGIEWNEDDYYVDPVDNDAFIMHQQPDMNAYVLSKPMRESPGERWYYSTGNSQLLSGVIEGATGRTVYDFAMPRLLEPLGLEGIGWDHDDAGHTHTGAGIRATVREYAKLGYLYLNEGNWDGLQVVSQGWCRESVQPASDDVSWYGYQWWLKPALSGSEGSAVPDGTFLAWGIYTQQVFIIPEKRIVIARVGNDPDGWDEVEFLTEVLESIVAR